MANLKLSRAKRLDQHVVEVIPQLSRSAAAKLIAEGKVSVNSQVITKPGSKLLPTDTVQVDFDASIYDQIPELRLEVLYEDDDCVVIIKPAGLLTHSKGAYSSEATVETWLRQRTTKNQNGKRGNTAERFNNTTPRAGIVHRLDRATSGVMICAKHPQALKWLQRQFSQRKVKKIYYAVVSGQLKTSEAIIDMPIMRNPKAPATFRVGAGGKAAETHYRVSQVNDNYSLLRLEPSTGRTHQLRVHLAHLGYPIVGDALYGGSRAGRMMLHAYSLEITLPNRERQKFIAPLPKEFRRFPS